MQLSYCKCGLLFFLSMINGGDAQWDCGCDKSANSKCICCYNCTNCLTPTKAMCRAEETPFYCFKKIMHIDTGLVHRGCLKKFYGPLVLEGKSEFSVVEKHSATGAPFQSRWYLCTGDMCNGAAGSTFEPSVNKFTSLIAVMASAIFLLAVR